MIVQNDLREPFLRLPKGLSNASHSLAFELPDEIFFKKTQEICNVEKWIATFPLSFRHLEAGRTYEASIWRTAEAKAWKTVPCVALETEPFVDYDFNLLPFVYEGDTEMIKFLNPFHHMFRVAEEEEKKEV